MNIITPMLGIAAFGMFDAFLAIATICASSAIGFVVFAVAMMVKPQ